jgi:dUTP pyrophosphatase
MDTIKIARLDPQAILPSRKHPSDAGLDLYNLCAARVEPHQVAILRTGVTVSIPPGLVGLLMAKSRSDHLLGAGVVDAGYQGEILIKVVNPLDRTLEFAAGQAIAQMLVVPAFTPAVEEYDPAEIHAETTARGGSGGIVDQHKILK